MSFEMTDETAINPEIIPLSPESTEVINPDKIYLAEIIQEVPMSTNNLCAPLIITVYP